MRNWIGILIVSVLLTACATANEQEKKKDVEDKELTTEEELDLGAEDSELDLESKGTSDSSSEAQDQPLNDDRTEDKEATDPKYQLTDHWSIEPIDDANAQVALITIDDAPETYAVEMAKILKELDAPAIFFVNGHFIDTEEEQAKIKRIHEMGFTIGNHTNRHLSLPDLSEEEQRAEIVDLNDTIENITGERPQFFRAPFGQNTEFSKQLASDEGMLVMNWTYGYDWNKEYMDAESLADIMVNTHLLRDGANLLMHDREWTLKALEDIITGLREKGYELVDPANIQTP